MRQRGFALRRAAEGFGIAGLGAGETVLAAPASGFAAEGVIVTALKGTR